MNTSCKYCVFKKEDNGQQFGCELDRIAKFKNNGAEIEHSENHLIVKNRVCLALRTASWAKKYENPAAQVREEIKTQCDFIVYVAAPNTLTDIERTLQTIIGQKLPPKSIRVIVNTDDINPNNVIDLLEEKVPVGIELFVDSVRLRDEYGNRLQRERALDIAADKCEYTYYAVFNAGFEIPLTYLADIDAKINDDLDRFCVLEPNLSGNGALVQTKLHKLLMGNRPVKLKTYDDGELIGDEIVDKVRYLSKEQNAEHMIKKVIDICQGM